MAVRKTKQENFSVQGSIEEWMRRSEAALQRGGFKNVRAHTALSQLNAEYKKATVWGQVAVTLLPEADRVLIRVESTANADNVFALFSSPTQKITDQFKNNL